MAGGEATKLAGGPSSWPHVSPDGKSIAYAQPSDVDPSEVPLPRPFGRADVKLMIIPFTGGEPVKGWSVPMTASLGGGSVTWTLGWESNIVQRLSSRALAAGFG